MVEKKWVKNSSYEMAWNMLKDSSSIQVGTVTTRISADKNYLTVITQVHLKNVSAPWIDSTVAEIETLKPVRHASYNMQRDMVLNFGKIVTGYYYDKRKGTNTKISDTVSAEYFDSNLYPVLIGWLPLENGYQKEISIYDYNPNAKIGVIKASIRNVSSGTYQTDKNGLREVWVVNISDEIGNGANGVSTYYFDKKDRKLWKQEIDANGRKMEMKLVE